MRAICTAKWLLVLAVLAGGGPVATAQPAPQAVRAARLEIHRGPRAQNCPSDASLLAGVTAQLGYDPFSEPADRVFIAVIDGAGGRYSATVSLQDPAGRPLGSQQLRYRLANCAELAAAVEMAIALAIDPLAASREPGGLPLPAGAPAPLEAATSAPDPATPISPPTTTSTTKNQVSSESGRADWRAWGGIGVAFRAAPTTVPAFSAGLEVGFPRYSLGLEIRGDLASHESLSSGALSTSLLIAALVPCYRWGFVGACTLVGAGVQWSAGTGLEPSFTVATPYFALGARVSGDVALTRGLWIRPELDLWLPIARTTLIVAEEPVWKTPPVSPVATLAIVGALP